MTFSVPNGENMPACSYSTWQSQTGANNGKDGVSLLQVVEGCGFSMAMVVRFALGLSANGGVVTVFASDSLFGWVVLAAARHLLNSGSLVRVIIAGPHGLKSEIGLQLIHPLAARDAALFGWSTVDWGEIDTIVGSSHNVLCGMADGGSLLLPWCSEFAEQMNDSHVPAHTVGAPLGVDLFTGENCGPALYASSTLSLGLPLSALLRDPSLVGRHYLADAGWSIGAYRELGYNGSPLFCEQPVIRLLESTLSTESTVVPQSTRQ